MRRNKTNTTEWPPEVQKHKQFKPKQGNNKYMQVSKWSNNKKDKHRGPPRSTRIGRETNTIRKDRRTPREKNTRRYCQSTLTIHKNLLTLLKLVVLKQQHYSTPAPHSVAFQNDSMIALAIRNHRGSLTQMPDQLS